MSSSIESASRGAGLDSADDTGPPATFQASGGSSGGLFAMLAGAAQNGSAPANTPSQVLSSAADPAVPAIDGSQFQSPEALAKWAPMVQGLPPAQQQAAEAALNRPIAAAQMLLSGTPAQKKAAEAYINANPSLRTAMDTASDGGQADGYISDGDAAAFIGKMQGALGDAANTVTTYEKNNPSADGQSLQLVRQAATLQANMPILQDAAPDQMKGGGASAGKYATEAGLDAIVQSNPDLGSALKGASSTFAKPGMFDLLDQGGFSGTSLADNNPDGNISSQNIIDWVSQQAPKTGGQFAATVSNAATMDSVAGQTTANLSGNIFNNPQNYTGAQKAAALVQLQYKQEQIQAGSSLTSSTTTNTQLQKDIDTLSADPSVQRYLAATTPGAERAIVDSDPSLARAAAATYTGSVANGQQLRGDLAGMAANNSDTSNTPETAGGEVSDFSQQVSLDQTLYGNQVPTAAEIVGGNASLTSTLKTDYVQDFSNGGELQNLQKQSNADLATSLQTTETDQQSLASVLNPNFVAGQSASYAASTAHIANADGGSGQAVVTALDGSGNQSPTQIASTIARLPTSALYGGSGATLSQGDTQTILSSFLGDLQSGASVNDALAKFDPNSDGFDPGATSSGVMAKLQANPALAASVQSMLRNVAASGLGLPQATAAPAPTSGSAAFAAATGGGARAGGGGSAGGAGIGGGQPVPVVAVAGGPSGGGTASMAAVAGPPAGYQSASDIVPVSAAAANTGSPGGVQLASDTVPMTGSSAGGDAAATASAFGNLPIGAAGQAQSGAPAPMFMGGGQSESAYNKQLAGNFGMMAGMMLAQPVIGGIAGQMKPRGPDGQVLGPEEAAEVAEDPEANALANVRGNAVRGVGEMAGAAGGIAGAAFMLPEVSELWNGGTAADRYQAVASAALGGQGIAQGGVLAANGVRAGMAAAKAGDGTRAAAAAKTFGESLLHTGNVEGGLSSAFKAARAGAGASDVLAEGAKGFGRSLSHATTVDSDSAVGRLANSIRQATGAPLRTAATEGATEGATAGLEAVGSTGAETGATAAVGLEAATGDAIGTGVAEAATEAATTGVMAGVGGAVAGGIEAVGAAAGPVGWAIDAAAGLPMLFMMIAAAVKKHEETDQFKDTVNPTLKQYGIQTE